MRDDERFVKITFQTTEQDKVFYQVIGEDLITINYDQIFTDQSTSDKIMGFYSFLNKWVNNSTLKEVKTVPSGNATLIPILYNVGLEVEKNHYIEGATGTILYIPISISTDVPLYIRNVICDKTHMSIAKTNLLEYIELNGDQTIRLILQNPSNFNNNKFNIKLDVYEDKFFVRKVGRMEFEINICSSNNPSVD